MAAKCLDCRQDATVDGRCYFHNKQHTWLIEPSCQYSTLVAADRYGSYEHEFPMDPAELIRLIDAGTVKAINCGSTLGSGELNE